MSESEESLLDELRREGRLDSEGIFTENQEQLFARLTTRLFQDPEEYHLSFLQALVASGATSIMMDTESMTHITFEATGCALELPHGEWPSLAIDRTAGARRFLAAGLVGAWSLHPQIDIESGGQRWTFRPAEGIEPHREPAHDTGTRIRLKRVKRKFLTGNTVQPRLVACRAPVRLKSRLVVQQSLSYSNRGEPLMLPGAQGRQDDLAESMEGVLAIGRGLLAVPNRLPGSPVFWYATDPPKELFSDHFLGWSLTRRFLALRRPLSGPSYLVAVEAGVALRPLEVDLGYGGLALFCSLEEEGLASDLGGSQLLRDDALDKLLEELRRELPAWMEAFRDRVAGWEPDLHSSNPLSFLGGVSVGMVAGLGLALATGVGAILPLAGLGGAYLGCRVAKNRRKHKIQAEVSEVIQKGRT